MTSVSVDSPRRFRAGFWIAVGLVFLAQVALVFWLSKNSVSTIRNARLAPELRITQARSDQILSFEDPTLFVLPHPMDFSGSVWMDVPELKFQSQEWSEPPRWLAVPGAELGRAFLHFVQTNATTDFQLPISVQPGLTMPQILPNLPVSKPGEMRIEGPLANRRLLTPPILPVQTSADLLTNSIVQVLVNAGGRTVSAVLLPPGSGSVSADRDALNIAQNARFESVETAGPGRTAQPASAGLTFGTMIFEWQTVPPTNAAPAASQP